MGYINFEHDLHRPRNLAGIVAGEAQYCDPYMNLLGLDPTDIRFKAAKESLEQMLAILINAIGTIE